MNSIENILQTLENKKLICPSTSKDCFVKERPSFLNSENNSISYGFFNHPVIEPPSSDDEKEEGDKEISLSQASEYLLDINTIILVDVIFVYLAIQKYPK